MRKILTFLGVCLFAIQLSAQEKFEVFFDFNKDFPTKTSGEKLQAWLTKNRAVTVTAITGFCDSVDVNDYNKDLAMRRVKSVLGAIQNSGIAVADNFKVAAIGEDFDLSADAAKNRRVDVFFLQSEIAASVAPEEKIGADTRKRDEIFEPKIPEPSLESKLGMAKIGDVIQIHNINFYFNSEIVVPESEPKLIELYQAMLHKPSLSIEIHGHICCNPDVRDTKLSYRRAKFIFNYLLKKGIPLNRLAYKGFGSGRPIYKIPEKTRDEMAANRRVEIKIVRI